MFGGGWGLGLAFWVSSFVGFALGMGMGCVLLLGCGVLFILSLYTIYRVWCGGRGFSYTNVGVPKW